MTSSRTVSTPAEGDRASWIEQWPAALLALSFSQRSVALDRPQTLALARRNGIATHLFEDPGDTPLDALQQQLDAALQHTAGEGAFVRLGSRSPKDSPRFVLSGGRAHSGAEAIALLSGGSRRMFFDLRQCLRHGWTPVIHLREWQPMQPGEEWRGFVRGGGLAGLSQYGTGAGPGQPAAVTMMGMAARVMAACPLADYAFDLFVSVNPAQPPRLIEINPLGSSTDRCLFAGDDFDTTLRWRDAEGRLQRRPLAAASFQAEEAVVSS